MKFFVAIQYYGIFFAFFSHGGPMSFGRIMKPTHFKKLGTSFILLEAVRMKWVVE